jgi:hypothetical protein
MSTKALKLDFSALIRQVEFIWKMEFIVLFLKVQNEEKTSALSILSKCIFHK